MASRRMHRWPRRYLTVHAWLFFVFLYGPLIMLFVFSFNANAVSMMTWKGFTFDWYLRVFETLGLVSLERPVVGAENLQLYSDPNLLPATINSIIVALVSASVSTVGGTLAAIGVHRYRFPGRLQYHGFLHVPIMIPDLVFGVSLLIFFVTIGIPLGRVSIMLAHTLFLTSYVYIVVRARLAGMDDTLEEASLDLGANHWMTFRRITLPRIMPGILGGFLLAVIISFDDLVIAYFTAGVGATTLPMYLFATVKRYVSPEVNAVASLLVGMSFLFVTAALLLRREGR